MQGRMGAGGKGSWGEDYPQIPPSPFLLCPSAPLLLYLPSTRPGSP
jgi:hypothetical protein